MTLLAIALMMGAAKSAATLPLLPPAPPIKSGSFSCEMFGRNGEKFELKGKITDWSINKDYQQSVKLILEAPDNVGLAGTYWVNLVYNYVSELQFYTNDTKSSTSGISGLIRNQYGPGMLILEPERGTSTHQYVGFCNFALSMNEVKS